MSETTVSPQSSATEAAPSTTDVTPASTPEVAQTAGLTDTNPMEQAAEVQPQQVAEPAPENYTAFKLGEQLGDLTPEDAPEFVAAMKELGLSQEKAQKLAESAAPALYNRMRADLQAKAVAWKESAKADKEFGGANFDANMAIAKTAYDRYTTPELRQIMNSAGLGCHPEFLRMFYRLGKDLQQDHGVQGGAQNPQQSWAKRLYPNTPQMRDE